MTLNIQALVNHSSNMPRTLFRKLKTLVRRSDTRLRSVFYRAFLFSQLIRKNLNLLVLLGEDRHRAHSGITWRTPAPCNVPGPDKVQDRFFPGGVRFRSYPLVCAPPTMLVQSELQCLAWLAEEVYQGRGAVVELGAWLGGSTVALATGLRRNRCRDHQRIFSYDRFLWHSACDNRGTGLVLKHGETFLSVYRSLLGSFRDVVEVVDGDILNRGWLRRPIELLFVDIMKTEAIAQHVASTFFPHLIPGAFVVHQDFKYWGLPYIIIGSYRLREKLASAISIFEAPTVVFACLAAVSLSEAQAAFDFKSLSPPEIEMAFQWATEIGTPCGGNFAAQIMYAKNAAMGFLATRKWTPE